MDVARLWVDRPGMDAVVGYWGPLLSWAIAPAYALCGDLLLAGKATAFLLGGIWILAMQCLLAWRTGLRRATLFTLVGVVPGTLFVGVPFCVLPDALLAIVVVGLTASMLAYSRSERPLTAAAAGALCGLGYLAKCSSWALFLPASALVVAWVAFRGRAGRLRRGLLHGSALALGFLLLAGPWVALVSLRSGRFTTGTATATRTRNWLGGRGSESPPLRFVVPYRGERWLLHNPWAFEPVRPVGLDWSLLTGSVGSRLRELGWYLVYFPAALLGIANIAFRGRRALRSRTRLVPALLGGFPLLFMVSLNVETRYLLFVTPPLLLAAAWVPRLRIRGSSALARRLILGLLATVGIAGILRKLPRVSYGEAMAAQAAVVRREKRGPERVWADVMAVRLPFAFLADCPMAVHDPVHEDREPEADLLVLRAGPDGRDPVREGFLPWLRWVDEDHARWVLLRRSP
jgi:4-amino-4-deoxy-L-arabinose transferase-like glycosyltransferase